jgi:hypothetical protein
MFCTHFSHDLHIQPWFTWLQNNYIQNKSNTIQKLQNNKIAPKIPGTAGKSSELCWNSGGASSPWAADTSSEWVHAPSRGSPGNRW